MDPRLISQIARDEIAERMRQVERERMARALDVPKPSAGARLVAQGRRLASMWTSRGSLGWSAATETPGEVSCDPRCS